MINRKQNIPQGWRIDLLENLADRGSGHTPDKNESGYWNGGIKWVSLADSWRLDNLFISETDKEISILGLQNSSAVLHPPDTVILSRDAGVGKSAILKSEMAVSQHFIAWRCQPKNKLNYLFFYYWLQLRKEEFERVAVGSTIKTIGLPYFKKLKIVYPPLAEQKKIAEIINCWDNAIAITEKLITAKRHLKQRLTKKLLTGKIKFFEHEGSITRSQNWQTTNLEDVAIFQNGKAHENNVVENGEFVIVNSKFISTEGKIRKYSNEQLFPLQQADIAMVMSDIPNGKALAKCFYVEENKKFTLNQRICSIRAKNIDSRYLFYFLNRNKYFLSFDSGVGQTNLRKDDILKCPILVPSILEQQKIAKTLSLMDQEISLLEKQLHSLKTQKQGLMQQLLTGKIRVQTP